MPTSYTTLLGLALPVTGELSGTWGDEVNNYITQYLDGAVAGTQTISGSQTAVTLSKTTGASLVQAGINATGSSQYQIVNCTGNPGGLLTITAPAASKAYLILNNTSTNQSVKIVGTGPTTGVTVAAARCALVAWNGSDFELVASTDASQLSGVLAVANGGTGATSLTGYVKGNGTSAFTASATIPNGDTTATSANTVNAIVARDASGNFSAGTITASLNGNASTASSATSAGTATNLAGGVAGAVPYQSASGTTAFSAAGSAGQYLQSNGTSAPSWVTPPTIGNGTLTLNVSGTGLSGSQTFTANQSTNVTFTVTSNATNANTGGAIVARDGSGNFSAGTITAALNGNASTATTATTANALNTGNNYQVNSLGVGTAASGTAGEIRATNNVTAYFSSDARWKTNVKPIENALSVAAAIGGHTFDWTDDYIKDHGGEDGYFVTKADFGVVAQTVQKQFPLAVRKRDDGTLAVDYAKLSTIALAALAEANSRIERLEAIVLKGV